METTLEKAPTTYASDSDAFLAPIREALRGLRFGYVNIIVQDGVIVHIDRTEKRRLSPAVRSSAHLAMLLATVIGCGRSGPPQVTVYPAKGQITFQGKPVPGAMVTLHPQSKPEVEFPTPRASVDADGTFRVSTFAGGDGAPQGKYTVTVLWYKPVKKGSDVHAGPNIIPLKYCKANSSPLVVEIAAQPTELPPIKL